MTQLSIALLISSCDAYSDVWPIASWGISRWNSSAAPVYLGCEAVAKSPPGFRLLQCAQGLRWSDALAHHLEQIDCDYVLLLLEDTPLSSKIDDSRLWRFLDIMKRCDLDMLRLNPRPFPEGQHIPGETRVAYCGDSLCGQVVVQPAVWRRTALLAILASGESAWDFERNAWRRARDARAYASFSQSAVATGGMLFHHVVEKGNFIPTELALFRYRGVKVVSHRPTMSATAFLGLALSETCNALLRILFRRRARRVREGIRNILPRAVYRAFAEMRGYKT